MERQITRAIVAILLIVPAALAAAQQAPLSTVQPNTLNVTAVGKYEAPPDTAMLQFNISPQEATAKEAYDHAARAVEQVRQLLRNNGVDPKSAEIGFFSLVPVYDLRQPKRKLIGYRVTSTVTLKLRDFSKVAPILQQFTEIDVTENQALSYTLENIDAAKVKALQDGYERARNEAEALAKAGGRTLGELSYASVDTYEPVRAFGAVGKMMAGAAAEGPPPPTAEFTPQHIVVTARVNAIFSMK
jgi:uncharacterized protein YggE